MVAFKRAYRSHVKTRQAVELVVRCIYDARCDYYYVTERRQATKDAGIW